MARVPEGWQNCAGGDVQPNCRDSILHHNGAVVGRGSIVAGGAMINFSSISYMMGNAGYPIYTTANAGITGMTRSLARELGPRGIRVNALAPGWVLTQKQLDMWAKPADLDAHMERMCEGTSEA